MDNNSPRFYQVIIAITGFLVASALLVRSIRFALEENAATALLYSILALIVAVVGLNYTKRLLDKKESNRG